NCARSPEDLVPARSAAIASVAPRKYANGDTSIRPWRTGTSSGTRDSAWRTSSPIGSLDAAGEKSPWDASGASSRAALPAATLCSRAGCAPRSGVLRSPVAGEEGFVLAATYPTLAPGPRWRRDEFRPGHGSVLVS